MNYGEEFGASITRENVFVALLSLFAFNVFHRVRKQRTWIAAGEKLPGPPLFVTEAKNCHPWVAHMYLFLESVGSIPGRPHLPQSIKIFTRLAEIHKQEGLFRLWIFNPFRVSFARLFILLFDPELARQFLTRKDLVGSIEKDKRIYDMSAPVVGDSFLVFPDGPAWKHHRKISAHAFHQQLLEFSNMAAIDILNSKVFQAWDDKLASTLRDGSRIDGTCNFFTVEMVEFSTRLTLEILGEVAFGCAFGSFEKAGNSATAGEDDNLYETYRFMVDTITRRSRSIPLLNFFWFKEQWRYRKCCKLVDSTIHTIVRRRLAEYEAAEQMPSHDVTNGNCTRNFSDLLSYLMSEDDEGYRLPYKYLFGNTRMFLFAGHDTTAGILSGALWELSCQEKIQTRLQFELDVMFEKIDGAPTYKDVMQLKYLDAVVKEALRLHASAGIARSVIKDVTLQKDSKTYTIPAGASVYCFPMVGHRVDKFYLDPLVFDPNRFLGDKSRGAINWFPFSYGPRNCVGQPLAVAELKIVLAHILHRYTLRRNANASDPIPTVTLSVKSHQVLVDVARR